jgi:hypothetical protein
MSKTLWQRINQSILTRELRGILKGVLKELGAILKAFFPW